MFDHCASTKDQLSFKKDDILYITDTLYNGHVGSWKAWIVNKEDAQQRESGMIPSRMKYATFIFYYLQQVVNIKSFFMTELIKYFCYDLVLVKVMLIINSLEEEVFSVAARKAATVLTLAIRKRVVIQLFLHARVRFSYFIVTMYIGGYME